MYYIVTALILPFMAWSLIYPWLYLKEFRGSIEERHPRSKQYIKRVWSIFAIQLTLRVVLFLFIIYVPPGGWWPTEGILHRLAYSFRESVMLFGVTANALLVVTLPATQDSKRRHNLYRLRIVAILLTLLAAFTALYHVRCWAKTLSGSMASEELLVALYYISIALLFFAAKRHFEKDSSIGLAIAICLAILTFLNSMCIPVY